MTEKEVIIAEIDGRINKLSEDIEHGPQLETLVCLKVKRDTLQSLRNFIKALPSTTDETVGYVLALILGLICGITIGHMF